MPATNVFVEAMAHAHRLATEHATGYNAALVTRRQREYLNRSVNVTFTGTPASTTSGLFTIGVSRIGSADTIA